MVSSQLAFDAKWKRAWMKRTNHDVIERLSVEHKRPSGDGPRHEEEEDDISSHSGFIYATSRTAQLGKRP
jgi:hypothetical protein